jgi:hypothetical protein
MKTRTAIRIIIGFIIMSASMASLADEQTDATKTDLSKMINTTSDETSHLKTSLEDLYSVGQDSDKQFLNNELDSSKNARPKVSKDADKSSDAREKRDPTSI